MGVSVGLLCAAILFAAAAFHIYWGAGGTLGAGVSLPTEADGTPVAEPGRLATIAVGFILLVVMLSTLAVFNVVVLPLPALPLRVFTGIWAILFFARAVSWHRLVGIFKSVRTTRFAAFDTWLYSPLCLVLALGLAFGAVAPPPV